MKNIIAIVLLASIINNMQAQTATPDARQLALFKSSKMYVVYDQSMFSTLFNDYIDTAMQEHWTMPVPYEFITREKYLQYNRKETNSFLTKTNMSFKDDKQKVVYEFLNIMLGTASGQEVNMPDLANFPLCYKGAPEEEYVYKMGTILIFMQNHIKLLEENPKLSDKSIIKHYNKNKEDINGKTLYVLQEELSLDVNTVEKIKKYYPYPVVIATRNEIKQVIEARDANAMILHLVGPHQDSEKRERIYKTVLGAADGKLYYWDYHKMSDNKPEGMLSSDFKSMAK